MYSSGKNHSRLIAAGVLDNLIPFGDASVSLLGGYKYSATYVFQLFWFISCVRPFLIWLIGTSVLDGRRSVDAFFHVYLLEN